MTAEEDIKLKLKIQSAYRVCYRCGIIYGKGKRETTSTWSEGEPCDICEEVKSTTEFRDFGYAKSEYYIGNLDE